MYPFNRWTTQLLERVITLDDAKPTLKFRTFQSTRALMEK